MFNDFMLNTTQSVTAVNLYEGDTITYSVNSDNYMFRVLKLNTVKNQGMLEETWEYEKSLFGPFIDRSLIKDF